MLQGARGFVLGNSSNIVISGFAFRQSTTLEIPTTCSAIRLTRNDFQFADSGDPYWVVVRANDTKIDRNHFHNKTTTGIFIVVDGPGKTDMAQNVQIFRNHFSDHSFTGDNGGEPIRFGVSGRALADAGGKVEYNLFERCDGDPEAISVKSSGNTIRYNTIRDSRGGIVLRHGNGSTVEGNYLIGGIDGVRIYGNDHVIVNNYLSGLSGRALVVGSGSTRDHTPSETETQRRGNDACDRAVIAHNSLINNTGMLSGETRAFEPQDVTIADNLLVGDSGSLVAMGATSGFTWQSNLLWGRPPTATSPPEASSGPTPGSVRARTVFCGSRRAARRSARPRWVASSWPTTSTGTSAAAYGTSVPTSTRRRPHSGTPSPPRTWARTPPERPPVTGHRTPDRSVHPTPPVNPIRSARPSCGRTESDPRRAIADHPQADRRKAGP